MRIAPGTAHFFLVICYMGGEKRYGSPRLPLMRRLLIVLPPNRKTRLGIDRGCGDLPLRLQVRLKCLWRSWLVSCRLLQGFAFTFSKDTRVPLVADFLVLRVLLPRNQLPDPEAWVVNRRKVTDPAEELEWKFYAGKISVLYTCHDQLIGVAEIQQQRAPRRRCSGFFRSLPLIAGIPCYRIVKYPAGSHVVLYC